MAPSSSVPRFVSAVVGADATVDPRVAQEASGAHATPGPARTTDACGRWTARRNRRYARTADVRFRLAVRCRAIALEPRCGGVELGDASVAGGKKVCAVRRIRACATRNRMPFRKNFLARVQAAGAVVAEVARRSRQPRNIIGAPDHDEEKARFPDVFFLACVEAPQTSPDREQQCGCAKCSPSRSGPDGRAKKVAHRC